LRLVEHGMTAHRHRALLVDHEDTRLAIQAFLEHAGFDVLAVGSVQAAFDALRAGEQCCVVLLDWRMRGEGGAAFLAQQDALPEAAGLPVVIATGDGVPPDPVPRQVGGILTKPLDPERLLAILARQCHRT
jgi:CheY-like chemotaxis protein